MLAGTAWTSVSVISEKLLGLITIAFLARLLEPKDFGTVAVCTIVLGIVSNFSDIGFQSAIIQRQTDVSRASSSAFYMTLALCALNYLLLFLLAKPIAVFYGDHAIENIVKILSLNLVIGSFSRVQNFLLSKNLEFGRKAVCETTPNFVYGLVSIPLAYSGFGVWSIVYGELAKNTVRTLLLFFLSRWKPSFVFDFKIARELIGYGKHVMFNNILNFASGNIDNAVVGKYLGLTSLSFYKLAYNAAAMPGDVLYQTVGRVSVPVFSKVQNDLEALKHQYFKILEYAAYIFVPVFAGLFIVAPGFINLLYGPKWEPAVILFRALLPFGFANVLKMFSDGLVSSTGRPSILPKITSIRIVLLIVLLYSILRFGLLPLCIGVSLVQIFVMILQFVFLKRYYNMPFTLHFKALQAPLIFSMVMMMSVVAIMRLLSGLHLYSTTALLIEVCSGLLIYFSLMLLFKKEIVSRLILVRQEWENR